MTGLLGALVPAPMSLAMKAAPYAALGAISLIAWHFDTRAVANADLVRTQAAAFKQAQATASQSAKAALQREQAAYVVKATEADSVYQTQLASAQSAADRYIATHSVQPQTDPSGRSSATAPAQSGRAGISAGVPTDAVLVSSGDVQACTGATAYALNAHEWAMAINPLTRVVVGCCASGKLVVRAAGIEPARAKPNGFSYRLRLSPPSIETDVRGLDYPFTMPITMGLGAARLVSTPSSNGIRLKLGSGLPD